MKHRGPNLGPLARNSYGMDNGQWLSSVLTVLSAQARLRARRGSSQDVAELRPVYSRPHHPAATPAACNMGSGDTGTPDPDTPARGGAQPGTQYLGHH